METWEPAEHKCGHKYMGSSASEDQCERPAIKGHESCPYHLSDPSAVDINLTADMNRRLAGLANEELDKVQEPLDFQGVSVEELQIEDLDLSILPGQTLDFRGAQIDELKLTDVTFPFVLDLRNADIKCIEIEGDSTISEIRLADAKVGRKAGSSGRSDQVASVDISGLKKADIRASGCEFLSEVKISQSDLDGLNFDKTRLRGDLWVGGTFTPEVSLHDAKIGDGKLMILGNGVDHLDAPKLQCEEIIIRSGISLGQKEENLSRPTKIDLTGAEVSGEVKVKGISITSIGARNVDTEQLTVEETTVSEKGHEGDIAISGQRIDSCNLSGISCAEGATLPVQFDDLESKKIDIEDSSLGTVTIQGGEVERAEIQGDIDSISFDTVTVNGDCSIAGDIDSASFKAVTVDGEYHLDTKEQFVDDIELQNCDLSSAHIATTCGKLEMVDIDADSELCLERCTAHKTTLKNINTEELKITKYESAGENSQEVTRQSEEEDGFDICICDSEAHHVEWSGSAESVLFTQLQTTGSVTLDDCDIVNVKITDTKSPELTIDGIVTEVEIVKSSVTRNAKVSIPDPEPSADSPTITVEDATLSKIRFDVHTPDSEITVKETLIERELKCNAPAAEVFKLNRMEIEGPTNINILGSGFDVAIENSTLGKTEIGPDESPESSNGGIKESDCGLDIERSRFDGQLVVNGWHQEIVSIVDSTLKELRFRGQFDEFCVEQTQVSERTRADISDINTLEITQSYLPRFNLTEESTVPVAETIDIESSDLPNAEFAAKEGQDLVTGSFTAKRSAFREADLEHASAGGGMDFDDSNLTDAVLKGTQLQDADLSNALLSRADLDEANLARANLRGTVFGDAQITRETQFTDKDGHIIHDPQCDVQNAAIEQNPKIAQSIYKKIETVASDNGLSKRARQFHRKRKQMANHRSEANSRVEYLKYGTNWIWNQVTGYSIGPVNVVATSLIIIILCGLAYGILALDRGEATVGEVGATMAAGIMFSIGVFFNFNPSIISPNHIIQVAAIVQTGLGALLVAVLIYTIGQRSSL